MFYTGIGSRETPQYVLAMMRDYAALLAKRGYTLRSGAAPGADTAFEQGCDKAKGQKQIFIPWRGFQNREAVKGSVYVGVGPEAIRLAETMHPAWELCSSAARKLHARNGYQVLGPRLDTPSAFVACYTKEGLGLGGTGQAIRLAKARNIPVFDLGDTRNIDALSYYINIGGICERK